MPTKFFIYAGNTSVLKNVPHKKDIGIKIYELKLFSSSLLITLKPTTKPIAEKTAELSNNTAKNPMPKINFKSSTKAISKIMLLDKMARNTPVKILPIIIARGLIGAIKKFSKVL